MNVGSWKNDEKGDMLLRIWKIIKIILEARKSSEYKKKGKKIYFEKKERKRKRKKREKKNKVVIQGKKSVLKNPRHL